MLALTRIHTLCFVVPLFLFGAQDPPKPAEPTTDERLRSLIEKTNALKSFVADYHFESTKGPMDMHLVYSAPDRIKLRADFKEKNGELILVYVDGLMTVHVQDDETGEHYSRADFSPVPPSVVAHVTDRAHELFPEARITDPTKLAGAEVACSLDHNDGEPCLAFDINYSFPDQRLLGWLPFLQKRANVISENSETLEFEGDEHSRFVLQKSSGFLESARVAWSGGERTLQLVKLETDVAIEAGEFRAPKLGKEAHDDSEMPQTMAYWGQVRRTRGCILDGVQRLVDENKSKWNEDAKSKLTSALHTLHASMLESFYSERIKTLVPGVDEFCWWFQTMHEKAGADPNRLAELDRAVEAREKSLRDSVKGGREYYAAFSTGDLSRHGSGFEEIDHAVFDAAYSEQVENPLLNLFTEKLALARARKLSDPNAGKAPRPPRK